MGDTPPLRSWAVAISTSPATQGYPDKTAKSATTVKDRINLSSGTTDTSLPGNSVGRVRSNEGGTRIVC